MAEIRQAYKLVVESGEDGLREFRHGDGTVVGFKIDEVQGRKYPEVRVTTKESQKTIDKIPEDTGYKKEIEKYFKDSKFEHRCTKCTVTGSKRKTLICEKEYNDH